MQDYVTREKALEALGRTGSASARQTAVPVLEHATGALAGGRGLPVGLSPRVAGDASLLDIPRPTVSPASFTISALPLSAKDLTLPA